MNDRVRHHPQTVIENLLDWCENNALTSPAAVSALGLAYVRGLNEHQMAAATLSCAELPEIRHPLARRAAEIRAAEWETARLDEPEWLAAAIRRLTAERSAGSLLFQPRNRFGVPVRPAQIATLASTAASEATGVRVTISTLVSSRAVAVREAGLPLALHGIGYAPTWAARLVGARPVLILPRRVS